MRRTIALLIAAAASACATRTLVDRDHGVRFRRPSLESTCEQGDVYGHARELIARMVQHLDTHRPRVEALIGCKARPPEVWLLDEELTEYGAGAHFRTDRQCYILVGPIEPSNMEHVLVHELSHCSSHECEVALPIVVEEALADLVSIELLPEEEPSIRFTRSFRRDPPRWTPETALQLTSETWHELDSWEELEPRTIGFELVREMGLEGIANLRERARANGLDRVPAEWFLGGEPDAKGER